MKHDDGSVVASVVRGAVAGIGATAAMSVVMLAAQRAGFMQKQPPEQIVERGADATDTPADENQIDAAATLAHFGFGALAGSVFGLVTRALRPGVPELLAVPWALGVWAVSYLGWVPALHIMPRADRDDPGRAWTMIAAHVVYGAALGALWRVSRR